MKKESKLYALLALTGSMTFFFITPIFLFLLLGLWLDNLLDLTPFCTIGGAILGFFTGLAATLTMVNKIKE